MKIAEIQMYGTNWCSDTARAKRCFIKHGISFAWCDIEKDKKGCEFVEKVNRNRSVPAIVFPDGLILVEPSDAELEKKRSKSKVR